MPRYIKGKPGIQMPWKTEVRRTGSFALNSVTMQLCYCRSLCSTQLKGKAATEPQKLLSSLLFQNIDWSRQYNTEGLMFCKSDCFEGQDLCYDVSAELSEKQNRQTRRAWRSPIRFSVFLPAVQKDPGLHPSHRWCLIALVTSYNIHKIPHHLTSVLEGSSVFFYYTNCLCYKSGQLLVLQMSICKANCHYSLYSLS